MGFLIHPTFLELFHIPGSWIGKNISQDVSFPNLIYRFNVIPSKIPESYFMDIDKLTLKFIWKAKDVEESHNIEGGRQSWRSDAA